MIENILQLVKEFGENEVINNPAVPNECNNAVMSEASYAVAGTMQQALANGNMKELMDLFRQDANSGQVMENPLAQEMQQGFISNITSKLGIDGETAAGIGASLLPMIMNTLVKRTRSNATEDSGFNLNSLIGSLTGGGGQAGGIDIGDIVNQFTGNGGGNEGGGFDISSLLQQISSGARSQQSKGGLSDLIQGFFGK